MPQHQRWLEPKFSEEHPFWSDGGWSSIFSKHSFRQVAIVLFILFFKTSWWKTASAVRNGRNSVPQTEVTTFAFSSVFIFPGLGIRLKTSYSTVDKQGEEKPKGQKWQSKSEENPNYEFYTESVSYFKRVQFIRDIWYKVQYSIKSWKWIKLEFLSSKICATSKGNTIRNRNSQFHLLYYEIPWNICEIWNQPDSGPYAFKFLQFKTFIYCTLIVNFFTTFEFKNLVRL